MNVNKFISNIRDLADELETMTGNTEEGNQGARAVEILSKHGVL